MKIIKFTLAIIMASLTTTGCAQNNSGNTYNLDDNMKIAIPKALLPHKDQLLERLKVQRSWQKMEEDYFDVQNEDIIAGGIVLYDGLINNGFRSIDHKTFKEKVKIFFGIDLDDPKACFSLQGKNFFTYIMPFSAHEASESRMTGALDFERQNFYFFNDNNILSYGAPLLTSYIESKGDGIVEFKVWEGDCHQNKFVFNDNDQSLEWLLENYFVFPEALVREFGYDKNEKLNQALLDKVYADYNDQSDADKSIFVNLFVKKNCKNELQIRTELVKYITKNTTLEDNELLDMLESYVMDLIEESNDDNSSIQEGFTYSERIEIFITLSYEIEKIYRKFDIGPGLQNWSSESCFYNAFVGNSELLDRIAENNYFNLEGLEDTIKNTLNRIEGRSENNSR